MPKRNESLRKVVHHNHHQRKQCIAANIWAQKATPKVSPDQACKPHNQIEGTTSTSTKTLHKQKEGRVFIDAAWMVLKPKSGRCDQGVILHVKSRHCRHDTAWQAAPAATLQLISRQEPPAVLHRAMKARVFMGDLQCSVPYAEEAHMTAIADRQGSYEFVVVVTVSTL